MVLGEEQTCGGSESTVGEEMTHPYYLVQELEGYDYPEYESTAWDYYSEIEHGGDTRFLPEEEEFFISLHTPEEFAELNTVIEDDGMYW